MRRPAWRFVALPLWVVGCAVAIVANDSAGIGWAALGVGVGLAGLWAGLRRNSLVWTDAALPGGAFTVFGIQFSPGFGPGVALVIALAMLLVAYELARFEIRGRLQGSDIPSGGRGAASRRIALVGAAAAALAAFTMAAPMLVASSISDRWPLSLEARLPTIGVLVGFMLLAGLFAAMLSRLSMSRRESESLNH
ncbi:MAG: hypothetical protein HYT80_08900 [Euryarchaeota archaeon]|nr:hypothetical protein [Euryarchaeota archaeon]